MVGLVFIPPLLGLSCCSVIETVIETVTETEMDQESKLDQEVDKLLCELEATAHFRRTEASESSDNDNDNDNDKSTSSVKSVKVVEDEDVEDEVVDDVTREELVREFDDPVKNKQLQVSPDNPGDPGDPGAGADLSIETDSGNNGDGEPVFPSDSKNGGDSARAAIAHATINKARTRHRQLMYRIIAGESEERIYKEMGIKPGKLQILVKSPLFQSELEGLKQKLQERLLDNEQLSIQDRLRVLNATALKTLVRLLTSKKGVAVQLQRAVAKDIIDYNLKLSESNRKGSVSEAASFFTEAFDRAEKRKHLLQRPAHLTSAPVGQKEVEETEQESAVNE